MADEGVMLSTIPFFSADPIPDPFEHPPLLDRIDLWLAWRADLLIAVVAFILTLVFMSVLSGFAAYVAGVALVWVLARRLPSQHPLQMRIEINWNLSLVSTLCVSSVVGPTFTYSHRKTVMGSTRLARTEGT